MVGKCQATCSKEDFKVLEEDEEQILTAIAVACGDSVATGYVSTPPAYKTTPSYVSTPTPSYKSTPAYTTKPAYKTPTYAPKPSYTPKETPSYVKPSPSYTPKPKPSYSPKPKPSYSRKPSPSYSPKPTTSPSYAPPKPSYIPSEPVYGGEYESPEAAYGDDYGYDEPQQYGSGDYDPHSYGSCSGVDYRCPTEGGEEFLQCDNGNWVTQRCAKGTVCIESLFTEQHVSPCGYPEEVYY
ncbi:hypothetical protein HK101_003666 [Irineochytrium annulatum]|nr:hypothetical protein HK101_003666 [Irineochytrium annulatum]